MSVSPTDHLKEKVCTLEAHYNQHIVYDDSDLVLYDLDSKCNVL